MSQKPTNDSSNTLETIVDISEKFQENAIIAELYSKLAKKEEKIKELKEEIDNKLAKITHLEQMLMKTIPNLFNTEKIQVPDEVTIAEMQLQKLKGLAMNRDLTLEETRKFEIFSKVKNIKKEDHGIINSYRILPSSQPLDLIKIAETSVTKEITQDTENE